MFCKDQLVGLLKNYGYNLVALPKENIRPLDLLMRKGSVMQSLGSIMDILEPGDDGVFYPEISEDIEAANVSGQKSSEVKAGVGVGLLDNFLSAMGASGASVAGNYNRAKKIVFEFSNVFENTINMVDLDRFLVDADIKSGSRKIGQMLEADELYIITSTIKSNIFTVHAYDKGGQGIDLNIPEIKGALKGDVDVSGGKDNSNSVTYESMKQLVFGFKAVQLFYDNGEYTTFDWAEDVIKRNLDAAPPRNEMTSKATFVSI